MNKATKIILYFVVTVISILSISICAALTLYCNNPVYILVAFGSLCSLAGLFSTLRTIATLADRFTEQEVEDDDDVRED